MDPNKRRILLIEPPFYRLFKRSYSLDRYPLSLAFLSGAIKNRTDWDVISYNADFAITKEENKICYLTTKGFINYLNCLEDLNSPVWREISYTISQYKPNVIGISVKSSNFASACRIAKIAKEVDKNIVIVVGGSHPSAIGKDILHYRDIDICVKGEGEETIVELLDAIDRHIDLGAVKGICYRRNGKIIENNPREFMQDLDLPYIPYEYAPEVLKDYDNYPITAFKNIFAIRGCSYDCFFCGSHKIWGRQPRFRSVDNIVKEIKYLQNRGLKFIHFDDDTFGIKKEYILNLCNAIISHCRGIKWSCELHLKLVDEEILSTMRKAGCYLLQIGIESGNNSILKNIRKNITIEDAISVSRIIKRYGFILQAFFIVGFPWETEDTINDTVTLLEKINYDTLLYNIFTPFPGTEAFDFCKKHGLVGDEYNASMYNYHSPDNCFCLNINKDRFRKLASKIEKMVDRKNSLGLIKRAFSSTLFDRVKESGVRYGLEKGINILFGR